MWNTFPAFCTTLLLGVMVCASYTFAISLAAGSTGRARTLQAARFGAYGTVALIATAVLCLAYALVSHDFRLRYVSHYSDRGMTLTYLLTALWGGQDGSLLWWLFLLSLYIGACVRSLGEKYLELQPYVIATLMAVVLFFCILMAFAANPFATSVAGARTDGEGLNPLLQNYWMVIHPPSLYTGFVGCTVPFSFAIAALVTGRLDQEWIIASRRWTLFSWMFLGIGNTLGMIWAYEELGWGGYWAWDPVENAAFMPFLTASAFIHSVMLQERRGLLKVWNVFLVSLTFLMTIFGTFLTRSGAIASVHSFAQSSIGTYFVWFIVFTAAVTATLIFYRWPELRNLPESPRLRKAAVAAGWVALLGGGPGAAYLAMLLPQPYPYVAFVVIEAFVAWAAIELVYRRMTLQLKLRSATPQIESILSREFTFLLNNYALLAFMVFVCVATTFPMISEALWNEKVTVGPPYYNAWVQPIGLVIFALMGIGTLLGWKKTSPQLLRKAFFWPIVAGAVAVALLALFGKKIGFAAVVWGDPIYSGALGQGLRAFNAITPSLGIAVAAFNIAVIVQEFTMLFRSRAKSGADKTVPTVLWFAGLFPGFLYTMVTLPPPSRRRYGGYIVHFGIVLMFLGFTGKSWTVNKEATLSPGQTMQVDHYRLEYVNERMEVDLTKRMIFADVKVTDVNSGKALGVTSPAKFIYKKSPDSPTTEVAQIHSIRDDLYLVVGSVNPQTHVASFQVHVNPLVGWIWFGCVVLIFGSVICMWPQLEPEESRAWSFVRAGTAMAASVMIGIILALLPVPAFAQTSSSHAGVVEIRNERERDIFKSLRCMCGGCQRLPLADCNCGDFAPEREAIRQQIAAGMSKDAILASYQEKWGQDGLTVPPNRGALRAIYLFPLTAILAGGVGLAFMLRRWRRPVGMIAVPGGAISTTDEYDARLDEELKDLDALETDERARAEQLERAFAGKLSWGLPAASLATAIGIGIGFGVGPAILVLAAGALVGVIALLWASVRTLGGDAPLAEGLATAAAMRGSVSHAAERKRRVLRALKDLELEHSVGKIDDADYATISARYREQAKEILREMDVEVEPLRARAEAIARKHLEKHGIRGTETAGDKDGVVARDADEGASVENVSPPSRSAPEKRVSCAHCRTSNEPDAEFCKKCRARLGRLPCKVCATSNEPDATFCKKCGASLASEEIERESGLSEAKDA